MARFIHTADWQIGTRFGGFDPDVSALLAEARFETVGRIASLAAAQQVDAVLVAGDVFDMHTVSDRVIRRLFSAMTGFSGPWLLIPGNHDAAIPEGVWAQAARLKCIPGNVRVITSPQTVDLPCGLSIMAAPLVQRRTFEDVTEWFDSVETEAGRIRVGLSHGSVTNHLPDSIDQGNPIANDRAARARLDYLALGDWHGVLEVDERTWYSGTPETDRFRNNRTGLVLDVTIDAPGAMPRVTEHRVGRYTWHKWTDAIQVPTDLDALLAKLDTLTSQDVLHLSLSGTLDMAESFRLEQAIDAAAARVRAIRADMDDLRLAPTLEDIEALGAGHGYLSRVISRLKIAQEDPEIGPTATEALQILSRLGSLSGKAS